MIAILTGWGLGTRAAKLIAYIAVPAVILLGLYLAVSAYADSVADDREEDVRAEYKAASDRLKKDAVKSATRADDAAAIRFDQHVQQVQEEQERIDEAKRTGGSPFDVLFGG